MTLLITMTAAVISTVIWYLSKAARDLKCGLLCYMFWGASLMWLVDAAVEYFEIRDKYFQPSAQEMLNDAFLGISAVVLALTIWVIYVLIKDPKKTIQNELLGK